MPPTRNNPRDHCLTHRPIGRDTAEIYAALIQKYPDWSLYRCWQVAIAEAATQRLRRLEYLTGFIEDTQITPEDRAMQHSISRSAARNRHERLKRQVIAEARHEARLWLVPSTSDVITIE